MTNWEKYKFMMTQVKGVEEFINKIQNGEAKAFNTSLEDLQERKNNFLEIARDYDNSLNETKELPFRWRDEFL